MKSFLAILALAVAAVAAAPGGKHPQCYAPEYACATNTVTGCPGWNVCSTEGSWVYGGDCPPKTKCHFNAESKSPYCI